MNYFSRGSIIALISTAMLSLRADDPVFATRMAPPLGSLIESNKMAMIASIKGIQQENTSSLVKHLLSDRESQIALNSLDISMPPEMWVNDFTIRSILKVLWVTVKLYDADNQVDAISSASANISQMAGRDCLLRVAAFEELCKRGDTNIWEFLIERSGSHATILDACILGKIVWGDKFILIPQQNRMDLSLDERPLGASQWNLPRSVPEQWRTLFTGSNGVYRILAMSARTQWVGSNETVAVYSAALRDQYCFVRNIAYRNVGKDNLHPNIIIKICEDGLAWSKLHISTNKYELDLARESTERLTKALQDTKARQRQ